MRPLERRRFIADCLQRKDACSYEELAQALRVSAMTIRRDVDLMARDGTVIKTLRGIQRATDLDLYETDLRARLMQRRPEKRAIAREAMKLLNNGPHTIFLDGGTTCLEFAKLIASEGVGLTAVSNSALVCLELGRSKEIRTVGIGGQYDAPSASFVGPAAEEAAAKYYVDLAFVSTKGLIADKGTFESSLATFHLKQIIARQAGQVVLLIDHSKFNQRALSKVLDIGQIHAVVTDDGADERNLDVLRTHVKQVIVAGTQLNGVATEASNAL